MNLETILWQYVQSQRHLLEEGIDDQDCHKLVCDYGDMLKVEGF
jgi:hypothetical protein